MSLEHFSDNSFIVLQARSRIRTPSRRLIVLLPVVLSNENVSNGLAKRLYRPVYHLRHEDRRYEKWMDGSCVFEQINLTTFLVDFLHPV